MDHFEDARIKIGNTMHTCVAAISHALRIAITISQKNIEQTAQLLRRAVLCTALWPFRSKSAATGKLSTIDYLQQADTQNLAPTHPNRI